MRPTPPAAGSSPQLAASTESLTAHGRRVQQPTVHLHISNVTPVRHAQGTLSIPRAFVTCAAAVQTALLVLFGEQWALAKVFYLGQMMGTLWANKTETKFTATFDQILPSIKYSFAFFFRNLPQILPSGQFFK